MLTINRVFVREIFAKILSNCR